MPIYLNNRRAAHAWISQTTITAGQLHIATKDGEAMFFHDSIDFSPYAGTDAGDTPYRLVFVDSAGKQAVAYGGAAGAGEAFDVDLFNGFDFTDTDEWDYGCLAAVVNSNTIDFAACVSYLQHSHILPYSTLVKIECQTTPADSGTVYVGATMPYDADSAILTRSVLQIRVYGNYSGNVTFDTLTMRTYTDVPATGLHLMSAKNGTTRNMTLVESGFNPNLVTKVRIYA